MLKPRAIPVQTLVKLELAVTLDDGYKQKFSTLPYLTYPVFAALNDLELFTQARVAPGIGT